MERRVPPEQEFDAIAERFSATFDEDPELRSKEPFSEVIENLRDAALPDLYAPHQGRVAQIVNAELDVSAPSTRGIGRLADGDPPPRLTAKYRKVFEANPNQEPLREALSKLVAAGFAAQHAIFHNGELVAREPDEIWVRWLRQIIAFYNDTNDLMSKAQKQSSDSIVGALTVTIGDYGGREMIEIFEELGLIKSSGFVGPLRKARNARPMTYLSFFLGVGRALRFSLGDKATDEFGSLFPVEMLEDYREPRSLRQAQEMV